MQITSQSQTRPVGETPRPASAPRIPPVRSDGFQELLDGTRTGTEGVRSRTDHRGGSTRRRRRDESTSGHPRPCPGAAWRARQGMDLLTQRASMQHRPDSRQAQAIESVDRFLRTMDGRGELEQKLRAYDEQILREASLDGSKPVTAMDSMRQQLAFSQQLNLRYLAIQEKLGSGTHSLLSNLMKCKHDAIREVLNRQY